MVEQAFVVHPAHISVLSLSRYVLAALPLAANTVRYNKDKRHPKETNMELKDTIVQSEK